VLAAEFAFTQPTHRAIQIVPGRTEGHYLVTFFERSAPLPGLQKLPFRRTQWAAIVNGHVQYIYLPDGRLEIKPNGETVSLALHASKLPPFTPTPDIGTISKKDFESAMDVADRMVREQAAATS